MSAIRLGSAALAFAGLLLAPAPCDAQAPRRQRDLITREEILASAQSTQDLYQAIRSLRPHFLAGPRGARTVRSATVSTPVVYVDGSRQSDIGMLRIIKASDVAEVKFVAPTDAGTEFGIGHDAGAILVKMWKAPQPTPP